MTVVETVEAVVNLLIVRKFFAFCLLVVAAWCEYIFLSKESE